MNQPSRTRLLLRGTRFLALLTALFFVTAFCLFFSQGTASRWDSGEFKCLDLYQHYAAGKVVRTDSPEQIYQDFFLGDWINQSMQSDEVGPLSLHIERFNYVYPPLVAFGAASLTNLDYPAWIYTWLLINVLAYAIAGYLLLGTLPPNWKNQGDIFLFSFAGFPCFYYAITSGQNTVLSLLIATASGFFLKQKRPLLAGLLFTCAFYKPQFMPFVFLGAFLCFQWRFLIGFLAGSTFWAIISLLVCGWNLHLLWLESLVGMGGGTQFEKPDLNQSWRGLLLQIIPEYSFEITILTVLLAIGFFLLLAWSWHRRKGILAQRDPDRVLYASLVGMLAVSPYVGYYDLLLGVPLWLSAIAQPRLPFFQLVAQSLFWIGCLLAGLSMTIGIPLATVPVTVWIVTTLALSFSTSPTQKKARSKRSGLCKRRQSSVD